MTTTCSHGIRWECDCRECDLVSAREVVSHWGSLVDAARAVIANAEPRWEAPFSGHCGASRDGECGKSWCPQLRDNEPAKSGRHCPLDTQQDDD